MGLGVWWVCARFTVCNLINGEKIHIRLLVGRINLMAMAWRANEKWKEYEYVQNGGGCDQNPVSVQTMLASPTSKCPSLQLNVTNAPTAYFRWLADMPDMLVPSMRPFIGTSGCGHWIAADRWRMREKWHKHRIHQYSYVGFRLLLCIIGFLFYIFIRWIWSWRQHVSATSKFVCEQTSTSGHWSIPCATRFAFDARRAIQAIAPRALEYRPSICRCIQFG